MQCSNISYFKIGRVPVGIGAALKGWNVTETVFRDRNRLHIVDFRAMTGECPHNCFHCFTDKQKKTLAREEIFRVIDQVAELGACTIDYLGEGETTIDPDFFPIIEYTTKKGIQPVIFTDAATKMRDRDFVRRTFDSGASVVVKCDSLFNPGYQNWVVGDLKDRYFQARNEAVELLIREGFNAVDQEGTTRLGFDMVVSRLNMDEVEKTLRYCREKNLWIVFAFYLPAGRSAGEDFDRTLPVTELEKQEIRSAIDRIDREFGFIHPICNNFGTMPCMELVQIFGDGSVSPCPGNETVIGNIKTHSIREILDSILRRFPAHDPASFDGHCLYRPPLT